MLMWFSLISFSTVLVVIAMTVCTAYSIGALVSLWRATTGPDDTAPEPCNLPVTVLKPLCGADDDLAANLETFFVQTHDTYELLFGVEGESDPAIAVVRGLQAKYPAVQCRLVVHDGGGALNPKVSNLVRTLEAGSHDVVLISDSNVACAPQYVAEMVAQLAQPGVGMVSSLFAGVGERTLGATLDNLHLNGHCNPSVALAERIGTPAVVGKSMMFRRSVFDSLGGFESVTHVLAEDYVMGRMLHEAGYRVVLDRRVLSNVNRNTTVRGFFRRHLRWGLLRSRLIPATFAAEPLSNPAFIGLVSGAVLGSLWPLLWALGLTLVRDAAAWWRLRGTDGLLHALPLGPLKDVGLALVWLVAPHLKRVKWRETTVRVSAGTRVYAEGPMAKPSIPDVAE